MTTTEERLSLIDVLDRVLISDGVSTREYVGTVIAVQKLHFVVSRNPNDKTGQKFRRCSGRAVGSHGSFGSWIKRKATTEDIDRVASRELADYLTHVTRERWMGLSVVELRDLKDRLYQADIGR